MNDIKHEVTRKPPLPLMIKYIAIMKNKIDELTLREEKLVEALKKALNIAEQSEEDPDIVLIEHLKAALASVEGV